MRENGYNTTGSSGTGRIVLNRCPPQDGRERRRENTMALRTLRILGEDDLLRKKSKPVPAMTGRLRTLLKDMADTMYEAGGVGIAAPQVGVLKRMFLIDVGEGVKIFVNPEIVALEGSQTGSEGCLSVPGKHATVTRAEKVTVRAFDENMEPFTLEAEGFFARAIQHEYDHLDGILYVDKKEGPLLDNEADEEEEETDAPDGD